MVGRSRYAGFSLIELMVSITIGMLIVSGVVLLISRTSASRGELEKMNRQVENGRFAWEVISNDLRHAGYYGMVAADRGVVPTSAQADPCSSTDSDIAASLSYGVQGISDTASAYSCLPSSAVVSGTDVLVIRRGSTEESALSTAGVANPVLGSGPYLQGGLMVDPSKGAGKYMTSLGVSSSKTNLLSAFPRLTKATPGPPPTYGPAPLRAFISHIYYISPCAAVKPGAITADCTDEPLLPTLKRLNPISGVREVIAEGIENLQVDFGVDAADSTYLSGDGLPNTFSECAAGCAWQDVVAAKVYLLARNVDLTPGYSDGRTYQMGLKGLITPSDLQFRRNLYSGVVRLNNVSMNRECTPTSAEPTCG